MCFKTRAEISDARTEATVAEDVDVKKKFGDAPPGGATADRGGRGGPGTAGGPGGPEGGRGRGEGGRGGNNQRRGMSFADLDKDKDGKLTQEELPERARQRFAQMDADGNGFVDASEHGKAMAAARKQMQQGGPGGAGGPPGGPGGFSGGGGR